MKNKKQIAEIFRECVVTLREASQAAVRASDALEKMPDNPTREDVAEFNKLLWELTASTVLVGTTFGNNLQKLEFLFSEN